LAPAELRRAFVAVLAAIAAPGWESSTAERKLPVVEYSDEVHEYPADENPDGQRDQPASDHMTMAFSPGLRVEHSTSDKSRADEEQNQGSHVSAAIW
jgi:hypothetical protein